MATTKKSKFAGIAAARAQRPANYFKPGSHMLVRVLKIEEGKDKAGVELVAAGFSVIHLYQTRTRCTRSARRCRRSSSAGTLRSCRA